MIWTVSFDQTPFLPDSIKPIGLSHTPPLWFKGVIYHALAPSYELLWAWRKNEVDAEECCHWYQKEVLDSLDPICVYDELISAGTYDVALCCWGRLESLCFRRLVAGWLNFATGKTIAERYPEF